MKLKVLLVSALALVLSACGQKDCETGEGAVAQSSGETIKWKLVTSWPKNFPGLGTGPEKFAKLVDQMSGGRLRIEVYGGGELVPALGVFDAVSSGAVEMGHSGAYYIKGKIPSAPFFSSIPFGMNVQE